MPSERYYCPECPGQAEFYGTATVIQGWVCDEHGHWIETEDECSDVLREPSEFWCTGCSAMAKWGKPPHVLEQLAREAE